MLTYLIQIILAAFGIVDLGLVAIVPEMTGGNQTIAS